jgi:hypothetical protein
MNDRASEYPITQRVDEPIKLTAKGITEARPRDLIVRFVAGAITSIVAGAITLAAGSRAGGILLAFPAILAASMTLIEEQEDGHEAREDSRGAVLGGCGMLAFAAVVALTLGTLPGAASLALASVAWTVVAVGGYMLIWRRRSP